jgi:hypothetical protein
MILRDSTHAQGQPAWLLITQIQHAHLSGRLAEAWILDDVPEPLRADLRWVSAHHDDGWQAWDNEPGLDEQGKPIDFLEMSVDQVNPIWARSIEHAAHHSPLAEHLVAWHFLALRAAGTSADQPAAQQFAATYQRRSQLALEQARRQHGPLLDDAMAARLRQFLQLFDRLSLVLCCGSVDGSVELEGVAGAPLICRSLTAGHLTLDPWPCRLASLDLELDVCQVPATTYRTAQELKQVAEPRRLQWRLRQA